MFDKAVKAIWTKAKIKEYTEYARENGRKVFVVQFMFLIFSLSHYFTNKMDQSSESKSWSEVLFGASGVFVMN